MAGGLVVNAIRASKQSILLRAMHNNLRTYTCVLRIFALECCVMLLYTP